MQYINCTPHEINIFGTESTASTTTILPSGTVIRVKSESVLSRTEDGIEFYSVQYGKLEGMPDLRGIKEPTVLITSALVKNQVREYIRDYRDCPDEEGEGCSLPEIMVCSPGELVRDEKGQPIGCRGLNW